MRYSRPADTLNPALDLAEREAFRLDLGRGLVSYPRNWPKDDPALGFTAYEPPPPPPPPPLAPETVALTRRQFWDWINGKFGVTEAQLTTRINSIANATQRARAMNYVKHESFMSWSDPFCTWVRGQLTSALSVTDAAQRTAWMEVSQEVWA